MQGAAVKTAAPYSAIFLDVPPRRRRSLFLFFQGPHQFVHAAEDFVPLRVLRHFFDFLHRSYGLLIRNLGPFLDIVLHLSYEPSPG